MFAEEARSCKVSAIDLTGKLPLINLKLGNRSRFSLLDNGATKSLIIKGFLDNVKKDKSVKVVNRISNYMKSANRATILKKKKKNRNKIEY